MHVFGSRYVSQEPEQVIAIDNMVCCDRQSFENTTGRSVLQSGMMTSNAAQDSRSRHALSG